MQGGSRRTLRSLRVWAMVEVTSSRIPRVIDKILRIIDPVVSILGVLDDV